MIVRFLQMNAVAPSYVSATAGVILNSERFDDFNPSRRGDLDLGFGPARQPRRASLPRAARSRCPGERSDDGDLAVEEAGEAALIVVPRDPALLDEWLTPNTPSKCELSPTTPAFCSL
jgi:hypothetical protein